MSVLFVPSLIQLHFAVYCYSVDKWNDSLLCCAFVIKDKKMRLDKFCNSLSRAQKIFNAIIISPTLDSVIHSSSDKESEIRSDSSESDALSLDSTMRGMRNKLDNSSSGRYPAWSTNFQELNKTQLWLFFYPCADEWFEEPMIVELTPVKLANNGAPAPLKPAISFAWRLAVFDEPSPCCSFSYSKCRYYGIRRGIKKLRVTSVIRNRSNRKNYKKSNANKCNSIYERIIIK